MSNYNVVSVIVGDAMAVVLLIAVAIGNGWRIKDDHKENKFLRNMILITIISALADALVCIVDGKPGASVKTAQYGLNSWIFIANLMMCIYCIKFLCQHLYGSGKEKIDKIFNGVLILGVVALVVNLFTPVVFTITDDNYYQREWCALLIFAVDIIVIAYCLFLYYKARKRSGLLKVFPVWAFVLPVLVAFIAQVFVPGISVIWAGLAVSIGATCASLQNDALVLDKLTGLYNRTYLDFLEQKLDMGKAHFMTGIMLDLNGFKKINEDYGHAEGDEVLKTTANIIKTSLGDLGTVIRYASDEFVALVNTQDDLTLKVCLEDINIALDEYNKKSGKPYQLSLSAGYCRLDLQNGTIDEFMNEIDRCLYAEKIAFYEEHGEYDRRKKR